MEKILSESETLRGEMTQAVTQDAEAYDQVMAAYQKPKSDQDREQKIQGAIRTAAEVPLGVARKALRISELAQKAAELGNKNAITDAGTGVNLAYAAVASAGYNVRINLLSLEDKKLKKALLTEVEELENSALETINQIKVLLTKRGKIF